MNFSGLCAALVGSLPPPAGGNQTSQRLFPSGFLLNLCGRFGMPGRVVPNVVDLARFPPAEGRARGAPVGTTDVGGGTHFLRHEHTALRVPPDAALRVLGDARLAASLRRAGLEEVRRYSWPSVRNTLLAAYQDALSGQSPSGSARTQESKDHV